VTAPSRWPALPLVLAALLGTAAGAQPSQQAIATATFAVG
jgi:hypothetical protein